MAKRRTARKDSKNAWFSQEVPQERRTNEEEHKKDETKEQQEKRRILEG
jgi:hypothetical protein